MKHNRFRVLLIVAVVLMISVTASVWGFQVLQAQQKEWKYPFATASLLDYTAEKELRIDEGCPGVDVLRQHCVAIIVYRTSLSQQDIDRHVKNNLNIEYSSTLGNGIEIFALLDEHNITVDGYTRFEAIQQGFSGPPYWRWRGYDAQGRHLDIFFYAVTQDTHRYELDGMLLNENIVMIRHRL